MILTIVIVAMIHWLKGFSIGDNRPPGTKRKLWHKAINFMTSDGWCGIYFATLAVFLLWPIPAAWYYIAGGGFLVALLYGYFSEIIAHKRILFVCYNGRRNDLQRYIDNKMEKLVAGSFEKPKIAALRYGTFVGYGFAASFAFIIASNWHFNEFSMMNTIALIPPFMYGVTYYMMNLLANPDKYGETIGRGIYGAFLGVSMCLATI